MQKIMISQETNKPMKSIEVLETELALVLNELESLEIEISEKSEDGIVTPLLRKLYKAKTDLAVALHQTIIKPVTCFDLDRIKDELHEAMLERVTAENRLGCIEDGDFSRRWNRFKVADKIWWQNINIRLAHPTGCPVCIANHRNERLAA